MAKNLKWLPLAFLLSLGVGFSYAAESPVGSLQQQVSPAASQTAPSINVPETIFHFGEVNEGAEVSHDFQVKNVGTATLEIKMVQPG